MSFRCALCGDVQDPGTKPVRVVTKIRQAIEGRAISVGSHIAVWREPWEIVEEVMVCSACAENPPEQRVVQFVPPEFSAKKWPSRKNEGGKRTKQERERVSLY